MAQKNAFYDPITNVLKCYGYVETNEPGDIKLPVSEDFDLKPGEHQWNGAKFVPYTKPVVVDLKAKALTDLKALDATKVTIKDLLPLLQAAL